MLSNNVIPPYYGSLGSMEPPKKSWQFFSWGNTFFRPRPFLRSWILTENYKNPKYMQLWHVGALFLCFLGQGIDCNHPLCPKTITWPILGPHPFLGVGILTENYRNPMYMQLWHVGALFLCFLGQGIDCNYPLCPKTIAWPILGPRPFLGMGILTENYKNPSYMQLWHVRALFLCFLGQGINCNHPLWPMGGNGDFWGILGMGISGFFLESPKIPKKQFSETILKL